ncbi:7406_t:CDS:2, partial [Scutellospora calospora]
ELDKSNIDIVCPSINCNVILKFDELKNELTAKVLKKMAEKLPEFRWCTKGCGSGQINHLKDAAPRMICENCGHIFCYTHNIPWHEGQTCREYNINNQTFDEASRNYLKNYTKPCPGCGIPCQKISGCDS